MKKQKTFETRNKVNTHLLDDRQINFGKSSLLNTRLILKCIITNGIKKPAYKFNFLPLSLILKRLAKCTTMPLFTLIVVFENIFLLNILIMFTCVYHCYFNEYINV